MDPDMDKAARLYDYLNGGKHCQIINKNSSTSTQMSQMAPKEGVKPIIFDFYDDDNDEEPSTANDGDNNEDSKVNRKKIDIFD